MVLLDQLRGAESLRFAGTAVHQEAQPINDQAVGSSHTAGLPWKVPDVKKKR